MTQMTNGMIELHKNAVKSFLKYFLLTSVLCTQFHSRYLSCFIITFFFFKELSQHMVLNAIHLLDI